jgi:hypothetical protein
MKSTMSESDDETGQRDGIPQVNGLITFICTDFNSTDQSWADDTLSFWTVESGAKD